MTGDTLKYRVGILEKRVNSMDDKIDDILQNHLPSLDKKLIGLQTEVYSLKSYIVGASIFNLAAIIVGVLISKYL